MKRWLMFIAALPLFAHAAAERIISLGGDVTEIVYALGAQQQLVAKDSTSTWPAAARSLPDVGYIRQPERRGDPVVTPDDRPGKRTGPALCWSCQKVEGSRVKVVNIPGGNDLSAIDKKIVAVADALGKQTEGDALRHAVAAQIAQIPTQPLGKRVLFILSHGGMNTMVAGQKTAADGAIQAAGCRTRCRDLTIIAVCLRKA